MRGPEGKIQDRCIEHLRKKKWEVVKIVICSRPGWPDTYATKNGRHLWIEFKKPGEEAEPLQKVVHSLIRKQKGTVWVIDDVAKFKEMLKLIPE